MLIAPRRAAGCPPRLAPPRQLWHTHYLLPDLIIIRSSRVMSS